MPPKVVTRSVRLEQQFDEQIERLAIQKGVSVSEFIRDALAQVTRNEERRRLLEKAMTIAARLPDTDPLERDQMWGLDSGVSR